MSIEKFWQYSLLAICITIVFTSCNENEILLENTYTHENTTSTRAFYDNGLVTWDNVEYLDYKLGGSNIISGSLSVPWSPGNAHAIGIPDSWIDYNFLNASASQRAYSTYNGWEMVYSNLLDASQSNKYFALYNKYTGILRFFFYEISSNAGVGSSTTYEGIRVTGSSLLNFTFSDPLPINATRPTSTTYLYIPQCDFTLSSTSTPQTVSGQPYKANNWYGFEIECAYDPYALSTSTIKLRLWSAGVSITNSSGAMTGSISGNISTTYTNTPNFDLSFSISGDKNTINEGVSDAGENVGGKIADEVSNNNNLFVDLWNELIDNAPSIAVQGIQAGVETLFTGGASLLVSLGGRLLNSVLGMGTTQTMTSISDVKLTTDTAIELTSLTTTSNAGWGAISSMPLAGYGNSSLYNNVLGVWNINAAPIVYVDQFSICYYGSFGNSGNSIMSIDPDTAPTSWETRYDLRLQPATITLNPAISNLFNMQNMSQELVFTDELEDLSSTPNVYGLNNGNIIFSDNSTSLVHLSEYMPSINLSGFNPNTSFVPLWNQKVSNANGSMYCRISFELVHKTTSQRIGFSKYFKVNAVKGNHYHNDIY